VAETGMTWTDERVAVLKKLWTDGLSASQIAKQIGGVTRNAVIGKVHRLGLSGRAAPARPRTPSIKIARPRPAISTAPRPMHHHMPAPVRLREAELPPIDIPENGPSNVLELGAHMCKWPIGDPAKTEFRFCGRKCGEGAPYCTDHARVAYQPPAKKRGDGEAEIRRMARRFV